MLDGFNMSMSMKRELPYYEGFEEVLETFKNNKIKQAIVSSKR